mgnify:FL=1
MKLQRLAFGLAAILLLSACGAKSAEKPEKKLTPQSSQASETDNVATSSIQAEIIDAPEPASETDRVVTDGANEKAADASDTAVAAKAGNNANKPAEKSGTVQHPAPQQQVDEAPQVRARKNTPPVEKAAGAPSSGTGTSEPAHTHDWQPVYRTIHHDEVGHYENVTVQKAYDEPIYEDRCVCKTCGAVFKTSVEIGEHLLWSDTCENYSVERVQVGTMHHDAVTEQNYVVDQPASDEPVISGYQCACGAVK